MDARRIGLSSTLSFTCLTELRMRNAFSPLVNDSFWHTLTSNDVHLERLHISPITQPAIDYLLSYEGLKTLKLSPPVANVDVFSDEGAAAQERHRALFQDVLPRHGPTLRNLFFEHLSYAGYGVLLTIRDVCERFEGIRSCPNLETLQLVYYYPDFEHPIIFIRPVAAIMSLINGLVRSAHRPRHLAIQPKRVDYRGFEDGDDERDAYRDRRKVVKHFKRNLRRTVQKGVEFMENIEVIARM
ncbi:hypothetical protein FA13DRAFT_331681 [Coprinellus micaceus]|uniref:Uncharacterized protein n=1 Tax=Coprinellus micaceus TaxID=71717 RepID=A0A4Y7TBG1_COPMI|nr:hypothetical protein FA13DRAFT_331681 [Coprinellus micaceus]